MRARSRRKRASRINLPRQKARQTPARGARMRYFATGTGGGGADAWAGLGRGAMAATAGLHGTDLAIAS
jgi:hypothetical protein